MNGRRWAGEYRWTVVLKWCPWWAHPLRTGRDFFNLFLFLLAVDGHVRLLALIYRVTCLRYLCSLALTRKQSGHGPELNNNATAEPKEKFEDRR